MRKYFLLVSMVFLLVSCDKETFKLDLQDNPNSAVEGQADINLVLNSVVASGINAETAVSGVANDLVRYTAQFGPYTGQFSSANANASGGAWNAGYSTINNAKFVMKLADELELPQQKGVAQVMTASALFSLVDAYGDVVYAEAANPEIEAPQLQSGEEVYKAALELLDEGIANLGKEQIGGVQDFVYGDAAQWIKYANSLKIVAYVNTRLVWDNTAALKAVVEEGNYIKSNADDFQFDYATATAPVDARSPYFQNNYVTGANEYVSNYLINKLKNRYIESDPRINYYVYRQTSSDPSGNDLPCAGKGYDFCYLGDGHVGRDHGDNLGVPADGLSRSLIGSYPFGGAFDSAEFLSGPDAIAANKTLNGAGIFPILLASQIDFLLAEASLTMNTGGDTWALVESGIKKSFEKAASVSKVNYSQDALNGYISRVQGTYGEAATQDAKLDVVITELYLASFMSGSTMYDAYRRTGMPSDIQAPVVEIGEFPRSLFLPTGETEANKNIDQKLVTDQVFWDNNPAGFIK